MSAYCVKNSNVYVLQGAQQLCNKILGLIASLSTARLISSTPCHN